MTWKLVEPATTWALVTMWPSRSKTMPEPSPRELRICTTDGEAAFTTCAKPSAGPVEGDAAAVVDESPPLSVSATSATAMAATTSTTPTAALRPARRLDLTCDDGMTSLLGLVDRQYRGGPRPL